jgi:lysozyme
MKPSKRCVDLVKKFEGLKLKSYQCPAKVWTIGYGSTRWYDETPVREGQEISIEMAEKLLMNDLQKFANHINLNVSQNQFDALVSFCYNLGLGNFNNSTLKKKVIANPEDESIKDEFLKWGKAKINGVLKELPGLMKRRLSESNLYYDKTTISTTIQDKIS